MVAVLEPGGRARAPRGGGAEAHRHHLGADREHVRGGADGIRRRDRGSVAAAGGGLDKHEGQIVRDVLVVRMGDAARGFEVHGREARPTAGDLDLIAVASVELVTRQADGVAALDVVRVAGHAVAGR